MTEVGDEAREEIRELNKKTYDITWLVKIFVKAIVGIGSMLRKNISKALLVLLLLFSCTGDFRHPSVAHAASGNGSGGQITAACTSLAVCSNMPINVGPYKSLSVQVYGTFSQTLTWQGSNDNTNWNSVSASSVGSPGTIATTTTAAGLFFIPINYRYFRVNATSFSSGTANVVIDFGNSVSFVPVPSSGGGGGGDASEATLATRLSESDFDTKIGSLTETAPASDTASSGINGRTQRIAQRLTTINTTLGSPFQAGGSIGNTAFQCNAGTNLNTSALATVAKQPALGTAGTASSDVITIQGIASMTAVKTDSSATTQPVSYAAATTGGYTAYSLISANTTNATVVKASAGTVASIQVYNINASPVYLKLYNMATTPAETDTPVKRILVPGGTTGTGSNIPIPAQGLAFSTGIAFRLVAGIADNSTTAVSASEQTVNIDYK